MSILIKGMEIPVTCCHCPLMGYDTDIEWVDGGRETQGGYICVLTHELINNTNREEHCPLVPVVRCKDCDLNSIGLCRLTGIGVNPYGYCAWGERKDDGNND